jgi:NTP pyrophosphatase (non-canonical NTP hydrolase)
MSLTFQQLRDASELRGKLWTKGAVKPGLAFAVIELAGEVGELANAMKKMMRFEHGLAGGVQGMQPLIDELADVVICADLVAQKLRVDLGQVVREKFNQTSRKHGFPIEL